MSEQNLKNILEAILLTSNNPVSIKEMQSLFTENKTITPPSITEIENTLEILKQEYQSRSFELYKVATGYRLQVKQQFSYWVQKLQQEKPPRYSKATLETLTIIAYKQPITRGEIEAIRGVSVSTQVIKSLLEREWITIIAHKPVPGKPALYGTTKQFLDDFNIDNIEKLPELPELQKDFIS